MISFTAILRHPAFRHGLSIGISLIFVFLVQYFYGWQAILAPWRDQPWHILTFLLIMATSTLVLRAWRLYDYFQDELRGHFTACTKLIIINNLFNLLLPMRAGELSFPLLMKNYFNIGARRSVPVLLWFRILDLHTVLAIGLMALGWQYLPLTITVLLTLIWLPLPAIMTLCSAHWGQHPITPEMSRWRRLLYSSLAHLPQSRRHLARDWLWTWLNWLIKLAIFVWVVRLFVTVSLSGALSGAIAGDLTSVLPIHGVAGSGTYEAGVMAGLALYDIPIQQSLQVAISLHLFIMATTFIAAALVYPVKVSKITPPG